MSTNILHISDLHFRSPSEQDKNIYYSNSNFCDEFASFVNEHGNPDYLIFTGCCSLSVRDFVDGIYVATIGKKTKKQIKNILYFTHCTYNTPI